MEALIAKLLTSISSPMLIALCIGIGYLVFSVNQKDKIICSKDEDIKELTQHLVDGTKTLERLTVLIESLINRGGR